MTPTAIMTVSFVAIERCEKKLNGPDIFEILCAYRCRKGSEIESSNQSIGATR
jgi:hypothetical protein